ncbi:ATP-binding protein [Streptomyces sp. NPDC021224]|uniref:ATP-binding protein n=1 Tax=unclassified Streptomyces TaxID=2593676 RepID=UPI003790C8F8
MHPPAAHPFHSTPTKGDTPASTSAEFDRHPSAPGRARRYVNETLAALPVPAAVAERAELVTSELVTNAYRHGTTGPVRLCVNLCGDVLTLTVADRTPYAPLPAAELPGGCEESGRGLGLVELLSVRWGHGPVQGEAANGTEVWAELMAADVRPGSGSRLPVCGERARLPRHLVPRAVFLATANAVAEAGIETDLRCSLQAHTGDEHHAFVMHIDGVDTGSVWTSWFRNGIPAAVEVRADCEVVSGCARGSEPCCEFDGHPGAHSFDVDDLWGPWAP